MKRKITIIIIILLIMVLAITAFNYYKKLPLESFIEDFYNARSEQDIVLLKKMISDEVLEEIKNDKFILVKISNINIIEKSNNRYLVVVGLYGHEVDQGEEGGYFYSDEIIIERIKNKWIITQFLRG